MGEAYYFWLSREDAERWGDKSKRTTGRYDIYTSQIACDNVLDTVFNEEHYNFWLETIEDAAKKIFKTIRRKPTLKELNDYLKERAAWDEEVTGILFQDLPANSYYSWVQPINYRDKRLIYFSYRKRIQLALYNLTAMSTFAHLVTKECV